MVLNDDVRVSHLTYPDKGAVRVVRVIGDFNGWSAPGTRMNQSVHGDGWTLDLNLDPGVYRYVYLENGQTVPTGSAFNKQVQFLVLPPADFKLNPAIKGDGIVTASGVLHEQGPRYVKRLDERTYAIRLRTRKDDVMEEAIAVWTVGGEQKNYPMRQVASDPLFDYYETKVVVNPDVPFLYRFLLDDGKGIRAYDLFGLGSGVLGQTPFQIRPNEYKIPVDAATSSNRSTRPLLERSR